MLHVVSRRNCSDILNEKVSDSISATLFIVDIGIYSFVMGSFWTGIMVFFVNTFCMIVGKVMCTTCSARGVKIWSILVGQFVYIVC